MSTPPAQQTFDSFDTALDAFGVPLENQPEMRRIARELDATRFEIPASARYVSAFKAAGPILAYFSKGFVDIPEGHGVYRRIVMPVSFARGTGGHGHNRAPEPEPDVCPVHQVQLPATRQCDSCAD
ncbi:hypothetical protein [Cellulomonas sp. Root137]|uniref:hypothetical protein n=1 Tax=Cellulomonas sp. Root137 TaxID=1736459 RepID=UPI0006FB0919|nr:hypothetical protein [Cellulomonas sp. Root137]KQY41871.1 hypothetical protein ASD18_19735 [Cellulomonas sp. Root137]